MKGFTITSCFFVEGEAKGEDAVAGTGNGEGDGTTTMETGGEGGGPVEHCTIRIPCPRVSGLQGGLGRSPGGGGTLPDRGRCGGDQQGASHG